MGDDLMTQDKATNLIAYFLFGVIATLAFIPAVASLIVRPAHAHDWKRSDLDGWYSGLRRPGVSSASPYGGVVSCCSKTDCHTTEAELRGNDWWARIGVHNASGDWDLGDWVKVPATSVLRQHDNPTGEGVICHSMVRRTEAAVTIWCFIPPTES
jgi:hypothetical protein